MDLWKHFEQIVDGIIGSILAQGLIKLFGWRGIAIGTTLAVQIGSLIYMQNAAIDTAITIGRIQQRSIERQELIDRFKRDPNAY